MITIQNIEQAIREVMAGSEIQYTNSVYEEKDGILRLILFFNKLFSKDQVIIYTKLMFNVDDKKERLLVTKEKNYSFKYLYDINCQYEKKFFDDINDFKNQWSSVIKNNKFGDNIKILSEFIKQPSFIINDWLNKNNVKDISVTGVKYDPRVKVMPCKSLFFHFVLTINNSDEVELYVKKEGKNDFVITLRINEDNFDTNVPDLKTFIQVIGEALKDKMS